MKLIDYVNIKQGTKSTKRFSNGNTLPLVQQPFGFAAFSPQTDSERGAWFYHADDRSFEGIRLTHQLSPWIGETAAIVIMPQYQKPETEPGRRWSGFRDMQLAPHYMSCYLTRSQAMAELTPTNSGACVRISFDNDTDNYISLLKACGDCRFSTEGDIIYCDTDCGSWSGRTHKMYLAFEFPKGAINSVMAAENALHIKTAKKCVEFKLSSSFISCEQAYRTMKAEHTYKDYDELLAENETIWEEYLSRISFEGEDEEVKRTFYSCMYRALLFPHRAYELDENGAPVHYNPETEQVHSGYRYTDYEMWDAYRTNFSLLPLIADEEYKKIIEGLVNEYLDCGWLPRLTAIEAKCCMPSTMVDAVLCDAAKRGSLSGEYLEKAFEGMLKHSNCDSPLPEHGRRGCSEYIKYGYVPSDKLGESVNYTLDAAYGDWCIAELAHMLDKPDIEAQYRIRAKNYQNLFDKSVGFMRGRRSDGEWSSGSFSPIRWGGDYTEAAAWQTTFAVQHDLDGLAELMGGRDKLIQKLDALFAAPPEFEVGGYGLEIHEMTEMAAADWGQCAISNQPSFHIPFIYAYFGAKEKTEFWAAKICREGFSYKDDGFPGDEDTGSMASWYILAMLGMYQVVVGSGEYVRFKPQLDGVRIRGKKI